MMAMWSPGLSCSLEACCARRKGAATSVRASVMIRKFMCKAFLYHDESGKEREECELNRTAQRQNEHEMSARPKGCIFLPVWRGNWKAERLNRRESAARTSLTFKF